MKKFIKIVVITFCSALILWTGVELYQSHVLNEYTYKQWYIENNGDQIKVLLLGNSYFFWSLNPEALGDSCFNAATNARWIYFDRVFLETRLRFMPNLTTVIYPVGYVIPYVGMRHHFEWVYPDGTHCLFQCYFHYKYLGIIYDNVGLYDWHRYRQEIIGGEKINYKTLINDRNCTGKGWQPRNGSIALDFRDTLTKEIIDRPEMQNNFSEYFFELNKMADICSSNNLKLVLVATPIHDTMKLALCQESIDKVNFEINKISKKESLDFVFLDYLYDSEFRDDSLYYVCDHLNNIGATNLGIRIKRDIGLK